MNNLVTEKYQTNYLEDQIPEIEGISYDLHTLKVKLNFPSTLEETIIEFDNIIGFRLLDEGDLLEFWSPETRSSGWIWIIKKGGWLNLEQTRSGFISGLNFNGIEFLITGINECLSVLSYGQPVISHHTN